MRRLAAVFLSPPPFPPGGDASPSQVYPYHLICSTHEPLWGTVRIKCLAREHNTILYFLFSTLFAPQILHKLLLWNALGRSAYFTTIVYAKLGGQTECIMGNWKIENVPGQGSNPGTTRSGIESVNYEATAPPINNSNNSLITQLTIHPWNPPPCLNTIMIQATSKICRSKINGQSFK